MALNRVISIVLSANTSGLQAGLRGSINEIQRFGGEVKRTNTGLAATRAGVQSATRANQQYATTLRQSGNVMAANAVEAKKVAQQTERNAKATSTQSQAMLGAQAAAVALGAGMMYAVNQAIEFDSAMRNVNSLLHQSDPALQQMEQRLVGMSKTLPQSATTLAEGMYDIVSSGFNGAEAMTVLESAAQGASAGLTQTSVSARAITATLNAYGRGAEDAADVTDVLFQTVNAGVITFEELAGNLGDVVGQASAAGVSIDQVGSAVATMTLSGVSGAEATTLLSNVFQKLIQPSDALADTYKKLGYESGASALSQKGLRGVMEDLRKATGGNITELMTLIPDMQAARGALALMSDEGRNYARVSGQIEDKNARAGATARTLAEQMKSAKNQLQLFKNNVDATATSVGMSLLPVLIKVMNGVQVTGHEVGRVAREIKASLGPTWDGLADTLQNLGDAAGDLAVEFGPLVAIIAKLAVGAVVVTVNALAQALGAATGLISEHTTLVGVLAIAYGVHLVTALVAAKGGMSVLAWKAFGAVLVGTMNKAEALAVALRGLATAQALATAGVAIVAAAGISAWSGYSAGAREAEDTTKAIDAAMRGTDFNHLREQAEQVNATLQRMSQFVSQQKSKNWLSGIFDIGDTYKAISYQNGFDELANKAQAADDKIAQMRANTINYLRDSSRLTGGALDRYITPITHDMGKLDAQVAQLQARAKAAGVDLGAPYPVLKARLDAAGQSTTGLAGKQEQLIQALGNVDSKATSAADAADALKDSLDALLGVAMNADEANDKWQASLDGLTKKLKENGRTLDSTTEKGRENRAAIRDSVGALRDKIQADAEAGVSGDELGKTLERGIKALYRQGDAADFPRAKMRKLLEQYNLTPELVETIVRAVGAEGSNEQVKALQEQIKKLKGKEVDVKDKGAKESTAKVDTLNARIKALKGKVVEVKDRGAKDSDKRVEDLHAEISRLQKRHDIMFRTPHLDESERRIKSLRDSILAIPNRSVSVTVATGIANKIAAGSAGSGDGYGVDTVTMDSNVKGVNKTLGGVAGTLRSGAKKAQSEYDGGMGGGGGAGMGYRKQMNILHGAFPGMPLVSGYRPGAITATGNKSYHSMGRAVDIPPSMAVFNWIRSHYGKNTKELIYSPAGTRQIHNGHNHMYTGVTRRMHFDHVHWAMKRGGVLNDRLPGQATIARNGADLVQWAEPGTGGEAFIPLGTKNRSRSTAILEKVADMFGLQVSRVEDSIADEAIDQFAAGGFRYPAFKFKAWKRPKRQKKEKRAAYSKRVATAHHEYDRDKAEARAEYTRRRDEAAAAYRENRRLDAVARGGGEGAVARSGSSIEALGAIQSAADTRRQASSQAYANRTRNQSDTAADYFRKPQVSAKSYIQNLGLQTQANRRWAANLTEIAAKAGSDVAASLERMGVEGEAAVKAMANASTKDMQRMAAEMRKLDFEKFTTTQSSNAKAATQFQGDLAALVKMGRADLASQFAEMGYEQAGGLARSAVQNPGAAGKLASDMGKIDAAGSQGMQDALRLAGLVQSSGGRLGVVGLSNKSGMGLADVLGLLTSYEGTVFGKMPATAMRQIRADQALLRQGKQPSGLVNGGIVAGAATGRGLYYRWAEQGSGGESLIPHAPNKRARALALYRETGRILGVQAAARPAATGGAVVVAPGAVTVTIPVAQPGASPEQIRAVAVSAVNSAMTGLIHEIKRGAR